MILNETYDEILERLDSYSLNESLFGQVKDQIKNQLQVSKILSYKLKLRPIKSAIKYSSLRSFTALALVT